MKTYEQFEEHCEDLSFLKYGDDIDLQLAEHLTDKELDEETGIVQNMHIADVIGNEGVYETVMRKSAAEPWKYLGACVNGGHANKRPDHALKIFCCSRLRDPDPEQVKKNVKAVQELCLEILLGEGNIPIAPHLYFPQILDDGTPEERELGIDYGLRLLDECDAMVVLLADPKKSLEENLSNGMQIEISHAVNRGVRPIFVTKNPAGNFIGA